MMRRVRASGDSGGQRAGNSQRTARAWAWVFRGAARKERQPQKPVLVKCMLIFGLAVLSILSASSHFRIAEHFGSSRSSSLLEVVTPEKRSKVHVCYSRVHSELGTKLLLEEFGYEGVDAAEDENWDLIYGGYPHCGEKDVVVIGTQLPTGAHGGRRGVRDWDWHMTSGLNKVLHDKGWNNLKPHQVYTPCMGCNTGYCNKRELCRILADINPEWCYVLPDHEDRLKAAMAADAKRQWVLKMDASDIHVHTGRGVSYIKSARELPSARQQNQGMYLVQPWNEPFLGESAWQRKSELRIFVAITSVFPLRAYVHTDPYVIVAAKQYTNSQEALYDTCMSDTHSSTHQCDRELQADSEIATLLSESKICNRCLSFPFYAEKVGMTDAQQHKFIDSTHELIASVLKAGHGKLQNHPVNRGIQDSGASCFSYMRVDVGITTEGMPFIFEFPEFHNQVVNFGDSNVTPLRELFRIVGLDAAPIQVEERAERESSHLGGWTLLPSLV